MMRIWDDNAPEWSPSEAVLHLQGEPIALKHWRDLYRYGKPGQWEGTKKHWANWRDIATSWQMLTEAGFWRKFSTENGPKSYTNICRALKAERKARIGVMPRKPRIYTAMASPRRSPTEEVASTS
ncbi:hypothetical protein EI94DRAFT_1745036 [Lactarius quietus]|nr:hypothetical protein EI94DRAFT_1745036 [Lactarius quietus]